MEVTKMSTATSTPDKNNKQDDDQEVMLPGFRFHPTDEELVGFYLRRKVEKKPIRIDIIKQADIYKYDPWDLPRVSTVGDKELYFFCMRGRKYRNSIRPNRVTGSGFWKATGIDKPIHSVMKELPYECIGLKKSLVYYRGSAGKGTKTDWMMHEFRLPPNGKSSNLSNVKLDIAQEAEVWTLCRIFKRSPSNKKHTPNWKDSSSTDLAANAIKHNPSVSSSKTCSSSLESETSCEQQQYMHQQNETKPFVIANDIGERNHLFMTHELFQSPYSASYNSSFWNPNSDDFLTNGNWDELSSVVELAIDPSHVYDCR